MGDIAALRAAAEAGDVGALTALGKRLLLGQGVPQSPREGAVHLTQAARAGGAEAHVFLAVLTAYGALGARDIDAALDHVLRAAELGWAPAQRELRVLARAEGEEWPTLRSRIDVGALTTPPAACVVSTAPHIVVVEGFASPAECDWLIAGNKGMRRAMVYEGSPELKVGANRTNSEADYTIANASVALNLIRERIAAVVGMPTAMFEGTKLLHYEPGQQFGLHADFQETSIPALAREVELRGQRVATFLLYLNDDFDGGETDFPRAPFRFKGKRGDALMFANVDADGAPDYATLHAGLPPTRGVKWLLSQWVRSKPVAL